MVVTQLIGHAEVWLQELRPELLQVAYPPIILFFSFSDIFKTFKFFKLNFFIFKVLRLINYVFNNHYVK